jgi:hypothetical protein
MSFFSKVWHKYLAVNAPWGVEELSEDGILTVPDFNSGYAAKLRASLPPEITSALTDTEVVKLWVERRNHEKQTPKLEVVHSDITEDGQVKLKLEWNDAFIRMLQANGFQGDSEDDLIQNYLHQVTKNVDTQMFDEDTAETPLVPRRLPTENDIEEVLNNTDPDTLKALEKSIRRRAAQRGGGRTRNLDR